MASISLEIIFFEKKGITYFCIFCVIFVYLLSSFFNERSIKTLLMCAESAIERILRAKLWLTEFESVF